MGQSFTKDVSNYFENFKDDFIKETHVIKELVDLSYPDFLQMIKELNNVCWRTVDCNGRTLLFARIGGSDSTILWRQTVQIACMRIIKETKTVETSRLLNLRQFLQAHKTVLYHIKCVSDMDNSEPDSEADGNKAGILQRNPISTSMILNEIASCEDLEECIICMERKPEVTLPCAHSYCLFCIEQWNVSNKTCPVCRERLENTDDTWVIPEIPESSEVHEELQRALRILTSKDAES